MSRASTSSRLAGSLQRTLATLRFRTAEDGSSRAAVLRRAPGAPPASPSRTPRRDSRGAAHRPRSLYAHAGPAASLSLAVALALGAGCGGAAEAFTAPAAAATGSVDGKVEVGLISGETMSFEVKLGGLLVGEAALAVGEAGDVGGQRAITVTSKIATSGAARLLRAIDDESTTVIDLENGSPIRLSTHVLMGGQETFTNAVFSPGQAVVEVRRGDGPARPFTFTFGDLPAHDAHSAMAHVRGWRPGAGAKRTVWLVGGRRLWRVDLEYIGPDSVGTAQGNRDAVRLDGIAYRANRDHSLDESKPPRRFSVWMSSDADRVPLRVTAVTELGDVEITLLDYQRP